MLQNNVMLDSFTERNPMDNKEIQLLKKEKPIQLSLFETRQYKGFSNTIELFDAIPKYYWGKQDYSGSIIKRNFTHKKQDYTVNIAPAALERDGKTVYYYAGEREELVEDALRKLACDGRGFLIEKDYSVHFSLYDLQQELKRMGHTFSIAEIKEAILVCSKSNIELKTADGGSIMSANFFITVGLYSAYDWKQHGKDKRAFVKFNPLVTKSIVEGTYRLLNYEKSMSYQKVISRWLHKRLSHNYTQANPNLTFELYLTTLIRDSGIKRYKSLGNNIQKLEIALKEMVAKEVVEHYSINKVYNKNKITDALITIVTTGSFMTDMKKGNYVASKRRVALSKFNKYKGLS